MTGPTPATIEQITPEWLTEVLRANGHLDPGGSVTEVVAEPLTDAEGVMGVVSRLRLAYAGGPGPSTMVAKVPPALGQNRSTGQALGVYEREVGVYTELLPHLDIPTPGIFAAVYDATGTEAGQVERLADLDRVPVWLARRRVRRLMHAAEPPPCVLLMEDLADVEAGEQVDGAPLERIEAGLAVLARLHAATWNGRHLGEQHWLVGTGGLARFFHALYLNAEEDFVWQVGGMISDHAMRLLRLAAETGPERIRYRTANVPICLVHGDYRLNNLMFHDDHSVASVIDWQGATAGHAVDDAAFFITSSLPADAPEFEVDALLGAYHRELRRNGVLDYPMERLLDDYLDALVMNLHRMTALNHNIDYGEERGAELGQAWLTRLDVRLQRVLA